MSFGGLGERLELIAMKAAGISLFRIMKPYLVVIGFLSIGSFYFSNVVLVVVVVLVLVVVAVLDELLGF